MLSIMRWHLANCKQRQRRLPGHDVARDDHAIKTSDLLCLESRDNIGKIDSFRPIASGPTGGQGSKD
jgi:hypothetical protein